MLKIIAIVFWANHDPEHVGENNMIDEISCDSKVGGVRTKTNF